MTVTTTTLASVQSAWINDVDTLAWKTTRTGNVVPSTRASLGGSVMRALTLSIASVSDACLYCGDSANVYGEPAHPMTASIATLIPCTLTDDMGGITRVGYVAGNLALAHVGCIAAANAFGLATGEPVVVTADSVHPNAYVPLTITTGRATSSASDPDAAEDLRIARVGAGWPF